MIAGYQIKGVFEIGYLFVKAFSRHFIEIWHRRHRMHDVTKVDDEIHVTIVQVSDHVSQSAIGALIYFKLGVTFGFTKIYVRIGHHGVGE